MSVGEPLLRSITSSWRAQRPPLSVDDVEGLARSHPLERVDALVAVSNGSVRHLDGACSHHFCSQTLEELRSCAATHALQDSVFRLHAGDVPLCGAGRQRCSAPSMSVVALRGAPHGQPSDLLVPLGETAKAESAVFADVPWESRLPTALWRGSLFCPKSRCSHGERICGGHPLGGALGGFNFSQPYVCSRTWLSRLSMRLAGPGGGGHAPVATGPAAPAALGPAAPAAMGPRLDVAIVTPNVTRALCGTAGWTTAVRCHAKDPAFRAIAASAPVSRAARYLPMHNHSRWRYLLHLDGHTYSSRLDWLLWSGSVVLKQRSPWIGWYYGALEPWRHFVPVWDDSADDALSIVRTLRQNDTVAQRIAAAGLAFARANLSRAARCDHWARVLRAYSSLFAPGERERLAAWARRAVRTPPGAGSEAQSSERGRVAGRGP